MKRTLYLREQDNLLDLAGGKGFNRYNKILCNELGLYSKWIIKCVNICSPLICVLILLSSFCYYCIQLLYSVFVSIFTSNNHCLIQQGVNNSNVFLCYTPLLEQRLKATDILDDATWIVGPGIKLVNGAGKKIISMNNLTIAQSARVFCRCMEVLVDYIYRPHSLYPIYKAWSFYSQDILLGNNLKDSTIYFSNQCDRWALLFDELPARKRVLVQHGITYSTPLPWRLRNINLLYAFSERAAKEVCLSIVEGQPEVRVMVPTIKLKDIANDGISILIVSHINHFELEKTIIHELSAVQGVTIIVKKHPTLTNYNCYSELQKEYGFRFIIDSEFPKVEYVISYFSTLAYEYMAYSIPVYVYMKDEDCDINKIVEDVKQLRK